MKSRDNSTTLLQYVVRFCIIRFDPNRGTPEANLPIPEPSDVERSSNINFDELRTECDKLKSDLDDIGKARDKVVESADSDPDHLEPFREKMEQFLEKASGSLKDLNTQVDDYGKKFVRTMQFYQYSAKEAGKPLKEVQPKEFFAFWYPFCQDYKNLWKREQIVIEKEMLKQERLRHKQRKETLKSFKTEALKPRGLKEKMLRKKSKAK